MKNIRFIICIFLIFLMGCTKNVEYSQLFNNISNLKEARNITSKIYNGYELSEYNGEYNDYGKVELPNHFNIAYALSISENGEMVYKFYTASYDDIGYLKEHNLDLFLSAINNTLKPENYVFMTGVCDEAFTTNYLNRLADDKYDIDEVASGIDFEKELLLNFINQIREKNGSIEKLTDEELNAINNKK